jgi:glutamate/aspartate transport system substrate-binding protein
MADIFICYRREDNPQTAWHLAQVLSEKFDTFIDVKMEGGEIWRRKLEREVKDCTLFIALIGERWLGKREDGTSKINDGCDELRQEIEWAIGYEKEILPVLVQSPYGPKISPPKHTEVPASIRKLLAFQFRSMPELSFMPDEFERGAKQIRKSAAKLIRNKEGRRYVLKSAVRSLRRNMGAIAACGVTAIVSVGLTVAVIGPGQEDLFDKIERTKHVTLGYREASYPLSFDMERFKAIDGQKEQGFALDLCRALIGKMYGNGIEVKTVPVYSGERAGNLERLRALETERIDLECGSTSITLEREKRVSFLPMRIYSRLAFVASKDEQPPIDLGPRMPYVTSGTTNYDNRLQCDDLHGIQKAKVDDSKDHKDIFDALVQAQNTKSRPIAILDDTLLAGALQHFKSLKDSEWQIHPCKSALEPYGIAFRKGHPKFRRELEGAWKKLEADKTICKLYKLWFSDLTSLDALYRSKDRAGRSDDLHKLCNQPPAA